MGSNTDAAQKSNRPKTVLLAGSARGGTSWALKVLDSHPSICGSHEPFYQLSEVPALHALFERLKAGSATEADAQHLVDSIITAGLETHKPPFFRKDFLNTPAWMRSSAWMLAKALRLSEPLFRYLGTGKLNSNHRLVIKNRPFPGMDRILDAVQADVLLLLRHPCGVVSSWLKGISMGVMDAVSSDPGSVWEKYCSILQPLGFSKKQLREMTPAGVLAVNWVVDTTLFKFYENSGLRTRTIVYCDLVRNPLAEWAQTLEWMGLPMCNSVEEFLSDSSRSVFDIRKLLGMKYTYFSVKRSDTSPLSAWRKHLSREQIAEIFDIVTPHFPLEQFWPDAATSDLPGTLASV